MPLNPLQNAKPTPKASASSALNLPQPYETSRRSNRPANDQPEERRRRLIVFTPQLLETSRWSNRTTLVRKPEDVACQAAVLPVVRVANKDHQPSPAVQNAPPVPERKNLAASIFFAKKQNENSTAVTPATSSQQIDYFSLPAQPAIQVRPPQPQVPIRAPPAPIERKEITPIPVETSWRSNKRQPPGRVDMTALGSSTSNLPPTPPLLGPPSPPRFLPKPIETTYRTNRKPLARPLVPQKAEEAPKTNLTRKQNNHIDLQALPQPVSSSRWSNRIRLGQRHFRRRSTVQPRGTPGPYYFVPATGQSSTSSVNKTKALEQWVRPEDHVEHLGEPVDSAPTSPSGSPGTSRCPSLSNSPTAASSPISSAASSSWEVDKQLGLAHRGQMESLGDGYSEYIMDLQRRARHGSSGSSISSVGSTTSDTCTISRPQTAKARRESEDDATSVEPEIAIMRAKARGETIKPVMKIEIPKVNVKKVYDDYPIFASPTRDKFLPTPQRVPTPELKPAPIHKIRPKVAEPSSRQEDSAPNLRPPPPNRPALLQFGRIKLPVVRVMYSNPIAPSPGITVASLPPRPITKLKSAGVPEEPEDVTDEFVREVWNYLSFGHECMARKYDEELAEYTGVSLETVKKDRFLVLKEYVRLWVEQNPTVEGGEQLKGGLW